MAQNVDQVYKTKDEIVAEVLAMLTTRIPDASTGPDAIFRIWTEMFANTVEGLYLSQQLLHDDMFIQTASALALIRGGEMYGRPQKSGIRATGSVRFSGAGSTYIPISTVVSAPVPATDETLDFLVLTDGTIPNPGIPIAPVAADASVAGALTGTYEYAISFLTTEGETEIGPESNALVLSASKANLTAIPLGGTGTTARRIYRRVNGGAWGFLADISNNTATTYGPDNAASTGAGTPVDTSTAERLVLNVEADEAGTDYNVAVGTVTILTSAPADISDVTNLTSMVGGLDEEDIETFRTALLKWVRAPQSGAPLDLEVWAEEIDGVESATCFPNKNLSNVTTAGTATVRIAGPDGTIPGTPVVDAVLAYLTSKDLANITILVGTFDPHTIAVTVDVTTDASFTLADVVADVEAAISSYLNSVPVAGTVYRAGIIDAIFGLSGIVNVTVSVPAVDVVLGATEKATPGTYTVT